MCMCQRLKWAFFITICPLSVIVVVIVNFSHLFLLLLQNHWVTFNQTWHKSSLGEGDSSLLKRRTTSFPRGDYYEIAKIHGRNLKIFFSRTTGPILTTFGTKHPWVKRNYAREIIIKLLKYIPELLGQFNDVYTCHYSFAQKYSLIYSWRLFVNVLCPYKRQISMLCLIA